MMIGIMAEQKKRMEVLAEVAVEHFRLVTQAAVTRTSLQTLEEDLVSSGQALTALQVCERRTGGCGYNWMRGWVWLCMCFFSLSVT